MRGVVKFPKGLIYKVDFISEKEEKDLLAVIESIEFEPVIMHDQVAKRTVKHFGLKYEYQGSSVTPIESIPQEIVWLQEKVAEFAEMESKNLVELLVTKYPPLSTIGWHRDAMVFGEKIIGISLNSSCLMRFQYTDKEGTRFVYEQELLPRSVYILSGAARYTWQHSIPPTKGLRYSLTFRTLKSS